MDFMEICKINITKFKEALTTFECRSNDVQLEWSDSSNDFEIEIGGHKWQVQTFTLTLGNGSTWKDVTKEMKRIFNTKGRFV